MIATFHNTIFDIKCSNCKRTQDNIYFQQRGYVFKTCNECRDRAARRRMCPVFRAAVSRPHLPIPPSAPLEVRRIPDDSDTDDDAAAHRLYYVDTDGVVSVP